MATRKINKKGGSRWDDIETETRRPKDIPAGHKRDEVARRVKDDLEEEAEALQAHHETMVVDPSKFGPDREILQILVDNRGTISGALPDYEYCWVRFKSNLGQAGLQVDQKLTWMVKDPESGGQVPVWETVQGSMPECRERKMQSVEGYRVVGDTLLMRARKDRYEALMTYFEFQHERRIGNDAKDIQDFAAKKQLKIHNFDASKTPLDQRGMQAAASAVSNMKKNHALDLSAARAIIAEAEKNGDEKLPLLRTGLKQMLAMQIAQQYVNKRIREGTLIMKGD